jgi:hypothetical protein
MDSDSHGVANPAPPPQEAPVAPISAPVTGGSDACDADILIGALGGLTSASRALGSPISTVQSWQKNRRVPTWRRNPALEAVRQAGKAAEAAQLEAIWNPLAAAPAAPSETPPGPMGSANA